MPHALQDVGAFLAAAELTAQPGAGEHYFGMDGAAYRALADHPGTIAAGEILALRLLEAPCRHSNASLPAAANVPARVHSL